MEKIITARTWQLLSFLADGKFHSGEELASRLGVSRASIFNSLADVAGYGVVLQRIRGRGYRLSHPWQCLERDEVLNWLGDEGVQFNIEILPQADSSNTLLLKRAIVDAVGTAGGNVLAVEFQTAGRGRLGRTWCTGIGSSLTFSLLWRFNCGLNALSGLSLAVGVAIARVLEGLGARGVGLKWPNDILTPQGKLGGVLIEAQGDMFGPSAVVIGIGINCFLPDNLAGRIDQPACALDEICQKMPTRNRLLAALLHELAGVLRQFADSGFSAFITEWEHHHAYQNRQIQLRIADGSIISGIARGVSSGGELRVETAQGMRQMNSGEVERLR